MNVRERMERIARDRASAEELYKKLELSIKIRREFNLPNDKVVSTKRVGSDINIHLDGKLQTTVTVREYNQRMKT